MAKGYKAAGPVDEKQNTRVGEMISDAMAKKGWSIKDLSDALEITYEHVRRIVKGEGVPSKPMLKLICQNLDINFTDEVYKSLTADQIEKRYGKVPAELSGKNPELDPIERAWSSLTSDQKHDVIGMVQMWSRRNKQAEAGRR